MGVTNALIKTEDIEIGLITVYLKVHGITPFKFSECQSCILRYNCLFADLPVEFDEIDLTSIGRMNFNKLGRIINIEIGNGITPLKDDDRKCLSNYGCNVSPKMAIETSLKIQKG